MSVCRFSAFCCLTHSRDLPAISNPLPFVVLISNLTLRRFFIFHFDPRYIAPGPGFKDGKRDRVISPQKEPDYWRLNLYRPSRLRISFVLLRF